MLQILRNDTCAGRTVLVLISLPYQEEIVLREGQATQGTRLHLRVNQILVL
jgi:hypothetical protein